MASTKVITKLEQNILHVEVSGYVGEQAELFDLNLKEKKDVKKVVVDLSGITYINSVGVKNWITWTGSFPPYLGIEFCKCPSVIVNQVNMVTGFLPPSGTVESLMAPFACSACHQEQSLLLTRRKEYEYASLTSSYQLTCPEVLCPKCKEPMELDVVEAKFFNFLKSPKPIKHG